jgi:CrcB protein
MLKLLLVIGAGGFLGSISRFLTSRFFQSHFDTVFPIGTLTVNLAGSFLIGLLYALSERGNLLNPEFRLFLTVGFCGGFTTFSSFSSENMILLKEGHFFFFALYASLSLFVGILTTYLGHFSIKVLFP